MRKELFGKKDLAKLYNSIAPNSSVLDLGCGEGKLLATLKEEKKCTVQGIDISSEQVLSCIEKGVPILQYDLNGEVLKSFPAKSFDYVILSQTIQQVQKPNILLHEMIRVGKNVKVTFVNIAFLPTRIQFLFGKMPVSRSLPYDWYNTPNIHLGSHKDFKQLCKKENIAIISQDFFGSIFAKVIPNIGAEFCLYTLAKKY